MDRKNRWRPWSPLTLSITPIVLILGILGMICFLIGFSFSPSEKIAKSSFLRAYTAELKAETSPAYLDMIKSMAKSELIGLHHGYGTGIRNRWLWDNRNPELIQFFQNKGIHHPDSMSMIIIEALWFDLNSNLSPEERTTIEAKRAVVARKRSAYKRLELQCKDHLQSIRSRSKYCYERLGIEPHFKLLVEKTGHVRKIVLAEGVSSELQACLQDNVHRFTFDAFSDDETVTLYIISFPHCRVSERDKLDCELGIY